MPEGAFQKKRFEYEREADEGVPLVRFESWREKTERVGARRLRWSPAAIHGELGRVDGTYGFLGLFRTCGWWSWSSASSTSMVAFTPADGGSGLDGSRRGGLQASNWGVGQCTGCTRGLLTWFGRRGWPHLSGSSWSPRRIGAAEDGGEGLLGVLLVSWRGFGEVEGLLLVEGELGITRR